MSIVGAVGLLGDCRVCLVTVWGCLVTASPLPLVGGVSGHDILFIFKHGLILC